MLVLVKKQDFVKIQKNANGNWWLESCGISWAGWNKQENKQEKRGNDSVMLWRIVTLALKRLRLLEQRFITQAGDRITIPAELDCLICKTRCSSCLMSLSWLPIQRLIESSYAGLPTSYLQYKGLTPTWFLFVGNIGYGKCLHHLAQWITLLSVGVMKISGYS